MVFYQVLFQRRKIEHIVTAIMKVLLSMELANWVEAQHLATYDVKMLQASHLQPPSATPKHKNSMKKVARKGTNLISTNLI